VATVAAGSAAAAAVAAVTAAAALFHLTPHQGLTLLSST